MNKDSSVCGICGKVWVADEPHYCIVPPTDNINKIVMPEDVDKIVRELKEAAENWKPSGGFVNVTTSTPVVSDLELKIRKEIMDSVGNIWHEMESTIMGQPINLVKDMTIIKDRLNLLWGE